MHEILRMTSHLTHDKVETHYTKTDHSAYLPVGYKSHQSVDRGILVFDYEQLTYNNYKTEEVEAVIRDSFDEAKAKRIIKALQSFFVVGIDYNTGVAGVKSTPTKNSLMVRMQEMISSTDLGQAKKFKGVGSTILSSQGEYI